MGPTPSHLSLKHELAIGDAAVGDPHPGLAGGGPGELRRELVTAGRALAVATGRGLRGFYRAALRAGMPPATHHGFVAVRHLSSKQSS